MIKQIFLIFVLVLIVIMMVACGSESPTPAAEPSPLSSEASLVAPTSTSIPATAAPVTTSAIPLSVTATKNLVYAELRKQDKRVERKLDYYAPDESGEWPIVLILPGAGQDKAAPGLRSLAETLAEQGTMEATPRPWQ